MSALRYISVCAGIEAASEAVAPLGWRAVAFSEIDAAAARVLAHRHPDVPNLGDFTAIDPAAFARTHGRVDVLFGGTPCQAFSVAGQRRSLNDARGNLTLAFVDLAHGLVEHCGLRCVVWENVPGVLNTPDNAFGCFLSGLVGGDGPLHPPGDGGWPRAGLVAGPRARAAWRVFDAQYFGLAQRRARVWLVVDFGDGADPAAVLFEPQGLRRHPPARGEAGEGLAATLGAGSPRGSGYRNDADTAENLVPLAFGGNDTRGPIEVATAVNAHGGPSGRLDFESETFVVATLDASYSKLQGCSGQNANHGHSHLLPIAFDCKAGGDTSFAIGEVAGSLRGEGHGGGHAAVAFDLRGREGGSQFEGPHDTANIRASSGGSSRSYVAFDTTQITSPLNRSRALPNGPCHSLSSKAHPPAIASTWAVRRLTPRECERLQGFPDDHTLVPDAKGKPQADGPRYRQIGNSWPVPVAAWICARIDAQLRGTA